MLEQPRGFKYWKVDKDGNQIISPDAPEWAKKEFVEYQEMMSGKTNGDLIRTF